MIGSENFLPNECVLKAREQSVGNKEIIDAPPDIPLTCICEVAPPGVLLGRIRIEVPKRIDETPVDEFLKSCALFIGETRVPPIRLRVRKINLFMCHVEITADDNRFECFKFFQMIKKEGIP